MRIVLPSAAIGPTVQPSTTEPPPPDVLTANETDFVAVLPLSVVTVTAQA